MKKQNRGISTRHRAHVGLKSATSGITLIALVITIIILLILAGVVLNLTLGDHGILKIAEEAGKNYTQVQEKEISDLNDLYSSMMVATGDNSKITISMEDLRKIVKDSVQEELKNSVPMFIDTTKLLTTITTQGASWTATEDCAVACTLRVTDGMGADVCIDGVSVSTLVDQQATSTRFVAMRNVIYVKKGSVISTRENYGEYELKVYGLK